VQEPVELFVGQLSQSVSGILLSQESEKRSSPFLDFLGMSLDGHAVRNTRVAGGNGARLPIDLDDAQAAAAERLHSMVITKRRNSNMEQARGVEDREALFKLMRLTVNGYPKQGSNSSA